VCSLQRLIEGIRILGIHPEAMLVTSGYAGVDKMTNAEKVKQAAIVLGVPENKIMAQSKPQDTQQEAALIAPIVVGKNIVLVTNADHMPRAIKYFQQQGLEPIAAPAGRWIKGKDDEKHWSYYLPKPSNLEQTTRAWYEHIGALVQWATQ
jgi:uncharacterized SAM-binding protein YcdF (DUF218 family)